ncbi:transcriptional regulator GutM [Peribacillus simplex]|nr:transcriptional regulator GutM [Peribacillus simplex]MEC1398437.1 transcriptional regulator GutM [Peribacillus simplex]MED3911572.1 transcriptional regulator GutM [Peribacillus simplex]MED4094668.1 transcriptional regulator GutM [Peribacillus simplex]
MKMLWYVVILIGFSWLLQSIFGFLQIKHFNKKYAELRKLGRVAIGKKTGLIKSGTVVMFAIDRKNNILKATKMQGVTVLSRVRNLKGFEGKNLLHLGEEDLYKVNKLTRLAIEDALNSYHVISKGGELKVKKGWIDLLLSKK